MALKYVAAQESFDLIITHRQWEPDSFVVIPPPEGILFRKVVFLHPAVIGPYKYGDDVILRAFVGL